MDTSNDPDLCVHGQHPALGCAKCIEQYRAARKGVEANFHKAITVIVPHLTKRQQGYVMGAFRAALSVASTPVAWQYRYKDRAAGTNIYNTFRHPIEEMGHGDEIEWWVFGVSPTPQPSAAEPKCGDSREALIRLCDLAQNVDLLATPENPRASEIASEIIQCIAILRGTNPDAAVGAQGDGVDERTRFIAWAKQRGMVAFDCEAAFGIEADDRFISPDTSLAWAAWKAALTRSYTNEDITCVSETA